MSADLIAALDRYLRQDETAGDTDNGVYRQGLAAMSDALSSKEADTARLDWLEAKINAEGEIHLHDGKHPRGSGLGLRPGTMSRTLREAIDAARPVAATQAPMSPASTQGADVSMDRQSGDMIESTPKPGGLP